MSTDLSMSGLAHQNQVGHAGLSGRGHPRNPERRSQHASRRNAPSIVFLRSPHWRPWYPNRGVNLPRFQPAAGRCESSPVSRIRGDRKHPRPPVRIDAGRCTRAPDGGARMPSCSERHHTNRDATPAGSSTLQASATRPCRPRRTWFRPRRLPRHAWRRQRAPVGSRRGRAHRPR